MLRFSDSLLFNNFKWMIWVSQLYSIASNSNWRIERHVCVQKLQTSTVIWLRDTILINTFIWMVMQGIDQNYVSQSQLRSMASNSNCEVWTTVLFAKFKRMVWESQLYLKVQLNRLSITTFKHKLLIER